MLQKFANSNSYPKTAINTEQLDEIVGAILGGKYSWACFLLLRCAGYNPLDYIPYRTYNRLIKENCLSGKSRKQEVSAMKTDNSNSETKSGINKIGDLDYLEVVRDKQAGVRGGYLAQRYSNSVDVADFALQSLDESQNILEQPTPTAKCLPFQNQVLFTGFVNRLFGFICK